MNTPTSQLLQELAACLPKEWEATYEAPEVVGEKEWPGYVELNGITSKAWDQETVTIMLTDDAHDGEAVMILLDYLESRGHAPALFLMDEEYFCTAPNGIYFPRQTGKTRSEAVARAVIAVLKEKENAL